MKKSSLSFMVLFFAVLLTSFHSFAQSQRIQVNQYLRSYQRMQLSQLMRLSYEDQRSLEIRSLSVMAQSTQMSAQLELRINGRPLASETVRRQMKEVRFYLQQSVSVDGLELSSSDDVYLDSIIAEVYRPYNPYPNPYPGQGQGPGYERQPAPNSLLTLNVSENIRYQGRIQLDDLVRRQLGVSLRGVQIDRVVVEGSPSGYSQASVQVELNGRLAGERKYLSQASRALPLQVQSYEDVRSLSLQVQGDAQIYRILIRVGRVNSPSHY